MFKRFPSFRQLDIMDCGPTCLRIISKYHGKDFSLKFLRQLSETTREGSSLYGISRAAEQIGMHTIGAKVNLDELRSLDYPLIIHWKHTHFVVLYKVKGDHFYISDPARGLQKVHKSEFLQAWIGPNAQDDHKGIILIVEPGPDFYTLDVDDPG